MKKQSNPQPPKGAKKPPAPPAPPLIKIKVKYPNGKEVEAYDEDITGDKIVKTFAKFLEGLVKTTKRRCRKGE